MTIRNAIKVLRGIEAAVGSERHIAIVTAITAMEKLQAQVHCRDCKHWGTGVAGETDMVKCCEYAGYMVGNNGYCVFAEKSSHR